MRLSICRLAVLALSFLGGISQAAPVRTSPGQPNIGDLYANAIPVDSKRKIILPEGLWQVNQSFEDKMANWHAPRKVITLVNKDSESPFPLVVIRYFSSSTSNWLTEDCEKKSNPHGFYYDIQAVRGRNICSVFYSFANPQLLFTSVLPKTYKFHWEKPLEKLAPDFVGNLSPGQVLLEATAYSSGGLHVKQEILVDLGKIGLNADAFKQSVRDGANSSPSDLISAWRKSYLKAMVQSFLDQAEVLPTDYAIKLPSQQPPVTQIAENTVESDSRLAARETANSRNSELKAKEEQEARARADTEAKEKEQARLRAEALVREKEDARQRAEALSREHELAKRQLKAKEEQEARARADAEAKEREQARLIADALVREKEDARQRAEALAKEHELARRQAEARTKAAEESAAREAEQREAALREANKKIEELVARNQAASKPNPASEKSSKRKALLIGNDKYQSITALRNARTDAQAMGQALAKYGYKVWVKTDLTRREMQAAIRQFKADVEGGDEVVIFYAGHAVQIASANYLLPIDIGGSSEDEIKDEAIQLQRLLEDMSERKTQITLAMVDACRDNPFQKNGRNIGGRGLAPTAAATGQMIIFSAGVGQQALDRLSNEDKDPNGLFTRIFIREMKTPGIRIDNIAREVRKKVVEAAKSVGHDQVPAIYDQVVGDFYFSQ
jgi:hypothetical protein